MAVFEHEVKFHLPAPEQTRRRLLEMGAAGDERTRETNLIFDDCRQRLFQAGELLRLRQDRHALLTHKSPVAGSGGDVKSMREREVRVADFDETRSILEALGYRVVRIYEKWRETFELGTVHVCLDTLPFGEFMEIEGEKARIRDTADRLGLDWKDRILMNYQELFNIVKTEYALSFEDITFDQFTDIAVDMRPLYPRITAEGRTFGVQPMPS